MRKAVVAVAAVTLVATLGFAASAISWVNPAPVAEEGATPQEPAPLDDATIVAIFDAANTADIETGRLASTRGSSKEVREFGAMQRLTNLEGPAFDHAFLQHEAAFHAAVIDAVATTLLPAIRNAELKALVVQVAPAFQAHMLAARNLEQALGASTSSSR